MLLHPKDWDNHLWKLSNQLDANGVGEFTYRCTGSQWAIVKGGNTEEYIAIVDKHLSKKLSNKEIVVLDFYVDTLMDPQGTIFQLNYTFSLCKN